MLESRHSDLTQKIIGCAIKVHKYFGLGFREEIYARSLLIELEEQAISCQTQLVRQIFYEEHWVGQSRVDILVEGKVLVELKARSELTPDCYSQVLNYLKIYEIEVGLLFNFGSRSLQMKRFVGPRSD